MGRFCFLCIGLSLSLFGESIMVSNKDIKYKEYLNYENLYETQTDKKVLCKKFDEEQLLYQKYYGSRYIVKNTPICDKDLEIAKDHKIRFDFGTIEIERDGEFLGETDKYIRVKKPDGTVEKIDKGGL